MGHSRDAYRAEVRRIITLLLTKGGGPYTLTTLGARVGRSGKTVGNWVNTDKVPGEDCKVALVAAAAEVLGDAEAVALGYALDGSRTLVQDADAARKREQGDVTATGPRTKTSWQSRLLGVIETKDGTFPTMVTWFSDDPAAMDEESLDHWRLASAKVRSLIPSYIPRPTVDEVLDARLREWARFPSNPVAPVLIVVGPPKAGKTRTVVEALRRPANGVAHKRLHEPVRPTPGRDTLSEYVDALAEAVEATRRDNNLSVLGTYTHGLDAVLFLDDLHEHFYDAQNHTGRGVPIRVLLERVARCQVPVVATIHPHVLTGDPRRYGMSAEDQAWLADTARAVHLPGALSEAELPRAVASLVADGATDTDTEQIRTLGLYLADIAALHAAVKDARTAAEAGDPVGIARTAIVSALCDAITFFEPWAIRQDLLDWAHYYSDGVGIALDRLLREAIEWVTRSSHPGGHPIATYDRDSASIHLNDALAAWLIPRHRSKVPRSALAPGLARSAADHAILAGRPTDVGGHDMEITYAAVDAHCRRVLNWLAPGMDYFTADRVAGIQGRAEAGDPESCTSYGFYLYRLKGVDCGGDWATHPARWLHQGLSSGREAWVALGCCMFIHGLVDDDPDDPGSSAIQWWRALAEELPPEGGLADSATMAALSATLIAWTRWAQGDLDGHDGARAWLQRSLSEPPQETQLITLAHLSRLIEGSEPGSARQSEAHWVRLAVDRCDSDIARLMLSAIRHDQGRLSGDPDGDDAETWLLQAARNKYGYAYERLGILREIQGRLRGEVPGGSAESWYLRAVEAGFESARAGLDRVRSS